MAHMKGNMKLTKGSMAPMKGNMALTKGNMALCHVRKTRWNTVYTFPNSNTPHSD